MKKLILIPLFILIICSCDKEDPFEPLVCDDGYSVIDGECVCVEGCIEIDGEIYYQSDLDVLQDLIDNNIDNNSLIEITWIYSMGLDIDGSEGIEPLELGVQVWNNGRLIDLNLHDYILTTLPESIGDLSSLKNLWLHYNNLTSLPESIGDLSSLVYLTLTNNLLTTLPESIGDLSSLDYLLLTNNQLTSLPDNICNLSIDWSGNNNDEYNYFSISQNNLCPNEYPECLTEENIEIQDTSECE